MSLGYSGPDSKREGKERPVATSWIDEDGSAFPGSLRLVGQHPRHCVNLSLAPAGPPSKLSNHLTL